MNEPSKNGDEQRATGDPLYDAALAEVRTVAADFARLQKEQRLLRQEWPFPVLCSSAKDDNAGSGLEGVRCSENTAHLNPRSRLRGRFRGS